jgi:spore coat protein U-like protein
MPPIAFGSLDVLPGAAVDSTSTITVVCSGGSFQGQRICISLDAGSANDGTSRQLIGPAGAKSRFDLYKNSARTQLWGSWVTGYNNGGLEIDVARDSTTPVTVYARFLGAQQGALPGTYSSSFNANPHIRYGNKSQTPCPVGNRTATASTSATATIISNCNVSATSLNFGITSVLASNIDATGTLTIQCSAALPYTVSLSGGNSGASDATQRKMSFGAQQVTYGLYRDSARTLPWGATAGVNTASGNGSGIAQNLTVFGRIAPQVTPQPGSYSDAIVATVAY